MNNDNFTVLVSGSGRCLLSEHVYCVAVTFKVTQRVGQWICIKFCVNVEHSPVETIQKIQKAIAMDNWWLAASSQQCAHSCIMSHAEMLPNINSAGNSAPYIPDLTPCNFWLFLKLKSPLKSKRFQNINRIQENMMGQLMAFGRTVWGPNVPTLKETEVSLSYVQCFLYLVSSLINISVFHIIWLDTFWTDLVYIIA